MSTKYKALVFNGKFANPKLLQNAIFDSDIPYLFPENMTIEALAEERKNTNRLVGYKAYTETYISQLLKCGLIDVELKIV